MAWVGHCRAICRLGWSPGRCHSAFAFHWGLGPEPTLGQTPPVLFARPPHFTWTDAGTSFGRTASPILVVFACDHTAVGQSPQWCRPAPSDLSEPQLTSISQAWLRTIDSSCRWVVQKRVVPRHRFAISGCVLPQLAPFWVCDRSVGLGRARFFHPWEREPKGGGSCASVPCRTLSDTDKGQALMG